MLAYFVKTQLKIVMIQVSWDGCYSDTVANERTC